MAFNRFSEGKQKLEDLTNLQNFRNKLKAIQKLPPALKYQGSVNVNFDSICSYFREIVKATADFFKNKNAVDLLKQAGVPNDTIDNYLSFWVKFNGKDEGFFLKNLRWGFEPEHGPSRLSDIYDIATRHAPQSSRLASLESMLGIRAKDGVTVESLIANIRDDFANAFYDKAKEVEETLTEYLQKQNAPKTNIIDLFRKEKTFE